MPLQPMYAGMVNSPETTLTNSISPSDTTIYVLDPSRVPEPLPNLMVLGTGTNAETVLVTALTDSALTVTRGYQGIPKDWPSGTIIARNFTAYDYDALRQNIDTLADDVSDNAEAISTKATKAVPAQANNMAGLDVDGNLMDTGIASTDVWHSGNAPMPVGKNWLDNADFSIWQRGEIHAPSTASRYTADRLMVWTGANATIGVAKAASGGCVLTGTSDGDSARVLYHFLENDIYNRYLKDETVTFSCLYDGVDYQKTFVFSDPFLSRHITGATNLEIVGGAKPVVSLTVRDSADHHLEWWKLELGSVATPFVPQDYWSMLAQCKPYGQFGGSGRSLHGWEHFKGVDVIYYFVPLTSSLRGVPTIIGTPVVYNSITAQEIAGFTGFSVYELHTNGVMVAAHKTAHGITDPTGIYFVGGAGFDSEIY